MKNLYLFLLMILAVQSIHAQQGVGIGTAAPHGKSILDLTSTTKGLLIPRMNSTQRTGIMTPPQGLMVFQNTGTTSLGFWYHDGTSWQRFAKASELTGSASWTISGINQYSNVDGNVGIGVTSGISEKLFLHGDMFINAPGGPIGDPLNTAELKIRGTSTGSSLISLLKTDSTGGGSISYTSLSQTMNLRNVESTSYMRFYDNGNIGIGTNASLDEALAKLQIKGGTFASYTAHGHLLLGDENGLNLALGHYEILARDDGAAAPLYLQQEGGAVRIGQSGLTADTRLHITDGNIANLSTDGYAVFGLTGSSNLVFDSDEIQQRSNGNAGVLQLQRSGGVLLVNAGAFTVASNGNVGIGTIAPTEALNVVGNGLFNGTNPTIALHNGGVQKGFIQLSGDDFRVGTFSDNDLGSFVVRTNGGDHLFVNPSGNVGIGTSNPLGKLDVAGNLRIVHSGEAIGIDGNNNFMQWYQNGVAKSYMQQLGNNLLISTSSGNSTGDIHIGAQQIYLGAAEVAINVGAEGPALGYSLSVGGEIICEELRVELQNNGPWPDYVFAHDYALRPLDELKSFITTHKHLPNIPAAIQVENEGFDVGDMNRRLLEKVEELTLYIIQQQEQIDELKRIVNPATAVTNK